MKRTRSALVLSAFAWIPLAVGCGGRGISDQQRPVIVAVYPTNGQVITGWLGPARVTFDEPVRVLDRAAVGLSSDIEGLAAYAYRDPTDPNSIVLVPVGGHYTPGRVHGITIREGLVVNNDGHYLADETEWQFVIGPRPNAFVASSDGNVYEINPDDGAQVSVTAPPAGFAAVELVGGDDEVFVWLKNTGVGSDVLAYFTPGSAVMTPIAIAGEAGTVRGVGFVLAIDGRTVYATALDGASQKLRVHRISTTTRAEIPSSIELSPVTPLPALARRPAIDPYRNRLYVAHADGLGGGNLSVVDLYTFTQIDANGAPGLSVPIPEGAGDLLYGPVTDRLWMTLAQQPFAGLMVIEPSNFAQYSASEPPFTQGPVVSALTAGEEFFVQGLESYTGTSGLVYTVSDEIGDGFAREVLDDVGGVLQGGNRIGALLNDPGSHNMLAFASNGTSTVMCTFDTWDFDLLQIDADLGTDGVQGIDLSTSAPGNVIAATFLRGQLAP